MTEDRNLFQSTQWNIHRAVQEKSEHDNNFDDSIQVRFIQNKCPN